MSGQIEIFQTKDGESEINVQFDKKMVWLTQLQMAQLFDKDVRTVNKHIQTIYTSDE